VILDPEHERGAVNARGHAMRPNDRPAFAHEEPEDDPSERDEPTMEIMMDYNRDCVNSLYRTMMWIRNPITRSVSSKALEYKDRVLIKTPVKTFWRPIYHLTETLFALYYHTELKWD
jgi:hypothetical protein